MDLSTCPLALRDKIDPPSQGLNFKGTEMSRRIDLSGPWRALSRAPMVRSALPMVTGIALAMWVPINMELLSALFLAITVATVHSLWHMTEYRHRWWRGGMAACWMFLFGVFWSTIRDPATSPKGIANSIGVEGPWLVRTIALNRVSGTQLRADAEVEAYYSNGEAIPAEGRIMLTLLRNGQDTAPRVGDRLLVEAPMKRILRIPDPGGFDRQLWAAARGIELELFATAEYWRRIDHRTHWTDRFSRMRQKLAGWVDAAGLGASERALVKALVLGQRDELDSGQRDHFARSGTIHVLAVSGLHVGLIYLMLGSMFAFLGGGRRARILRSVLVLVALWTYAGITGGAPSVLRASVMFSFIAIADATARRTDRINSLFAAMFLLLLWDPHMLRLIGFQLSFLAVLGILVFFDPIADLWKPRSWIMQKIWSLAVISIAAQLFTTPASIYYFNAFPIWFLPANIVVVSAVSFAVWTSIGLIIFHQVPFLGDALVMLITALLKIVTEVNSFFAEMPFSYPPLRIDAMITVLLYIIILTFAADRLWRWRSMRWARSMAIMVLLIVWGSNAKTVNEMHTFTLYDEREGIMAAITQGRKYTVLADPQKLNADPYRQRKIDQHRRAIGLQPPELIPIGDLRDGSSINTRGGTSAGEGRWMSDRFDVLFVDDPAAPIVQVPDQRFDVIVLHDLQHIPEELLRTAARAAGQLVIAGKSNWRTREWVAKWCRDHEVPLHDVFAQGAFVLTER